MMKKLCVVISVISAFLVAISIQCSAEDNIIYGCIGKKEILRVVSDPSECKESETAIYWNKVGPQGPQGEQGPPGECDPAMIDDLQNQINGLQDQLDYLMSVIVIRRFTDLGNETIRDNDTGLIWLKDANCFGTMNWDSAMATVPTLADSECGLSDGSNIGDWRLPTKEEWETFVDTKYFNPALCNAAGWDQWSEGDAFDNVQIEPYWSSTPSENSNLSAWFVNMDVGDLDRTGKTALLYVWPVRVGN